MNKNMRKMYTEEEIKDVINYAIEKGLINNVKPLYWHSVTLKRIYNNELDFYFDFVIINDDNRQFSRDSFKVWLDSHQTAEIKCVQGYDKTYPSNLVSKFKYAASNQIIVTSIKLDTGVSQTNTYNITESSGTTLSDVVDKIN